MISSKAIEVLATFTPGELKEFAQFIRSPYFNSNKNLIKLYDVAKDSLNKDVSEEFLYGKVFPGKKYNYGIFKNLLSELYVQVCEYLAVKRVRQKTADKNSYLIKELVDRKLVKQADKWIKTTQDQLLDKVLSVEDLHTQFLMEEYSTFSNYFRDQRWLINLSKKDDALMMSKKFAVYFLARFMSHYLFITHSMFTLKKEMDMAPMLNIINDTYGFLKSNLEEEIPTVEILYHIIRMNNDARNEEWFNKLRQIVLKYKDDVPSQVGRNGFIYLFNYCEDRIEEGNDKFIKDFFDLLVEYLKGDLAMKVTNSISPETYEMFVVNGLAAGEMKKVRKFIDEYKDKLPDEYREECTNFAKAYFNLYDGKYEKAMESISKVNPEFLMGQLERKELQLMVYYELGEWDRFYSLVSSLKGLITNHSKLHPERKTSRLAFIKNINALGKIKESIGVKKSGMDVKLNDLLRKFKKEPSVSRVWFSAKANELKSMLEK